MSKCDSCLLPRSALDDHADCLVCTGCTSDDCCDVCRAWSEDKWSATLAFYADRGQDQDSDKDRGAGPSEEEDPPQLEKEGDDDSDLSSSGKPKKEASTAKSALSESERHDRVSRSRTPSPRYVRTETRDRDMSADKRVQSVVRTVSESRHRPQSPKRRDRRGRSPPRRERRRRSPPARDHYARRHRSSPDRAVHFAPEQNRRDDDYDRDPQVHFVWRSPRRREQYQPRYYDRPYHPMEVNQFDWFPPPRYAPEEQYFDPYAFHYADRVPEEDPDRMWGAYEDYYINDPQPNHAVHPFYAPPEPEPVAEQEPQVVAPPPRRILKKRKAEPEQQEQSDLPETETEDQNGDDDSSSSSSSADSSSSSDEEGDKKKKKETKGQIFKKAAKKIMKLLPSAKRSNRQSSARYTAGALVDQSELLKKKLDSTLPQPPNLRHAVKAINEHITSSTFATKNMFMADSTWPKDMNCQFRLEWYSGQAAQHYVCQKPLLEEEMAEFAGGPQEATAKMPDILTKISTLSRNALAVASYLTLATKAISKAATSNKKSKKQLKTIALLAKVANRAADHAATNSMVASANLDLWRRDVVLANCDKLPAVAKQTLRKAPLGGKTIFDEEVCKATRKKYPNAVKQSTSGGKSQGGGNKPPFQAGRGGQGQPPRQNNKQAPASTATTSNPGSGHASNNQNASYFKRKRNRGGQNKGNKQ